MKFDVHDIIRVVESLETALNKFQKVGFTPVLKFQKTTKC